MQAKDIVKLFLRGSLGVGFLSPVADRFGWWGDSWGNWSSFVEYTAQLMPWLSSGIAEVAAVIATTLEIVLGLALLLGFKVKITAILSGILLILFAVAMTTALGIKAPLNFSVFTASAAAFALATMKNNILEIK